MNSKLIGGILLIIGTSIGGGMLALPVSTAEMGFSHSLIFLCFCWLVMTAGALLLLEVNLRLPSGSNMISMAKYTLGVPGQIIAWITYLFLLYTLLAAYVSGGSDVLGSLFDKIGIHLSPTFTSIAFTGVFSAIVYHGIRTVDYVNRGLMFGKLGIYLFLVILISPFVSTNGWSGGSISAWSGTLMILITSFGYASIVPSLRDYFAEDISSLRKAILLGSLVPLFCYMIWDGVIMGVVPREGSQGLIALMQSEHATSGLTDALSLSIHSTWIGALFRFFTSICMLTAFLAVSLGLFDFIADGVQFKKTGIQGLYTLLITFLPPLIIVLFKPGIYLNALSYAGICCVVLLLLLPAIMAWRGRISDLKNCRKNPILVPGGKKVLFILIVIGLSLLGVAFVS